MTKLTLYAMTKKGFVVLTSLQAHYPGIVDTVVCARDANVVRDYHDDIRTYCGEHKIRFHDRHDDFITTTEFSLAVAWRWLIDCQTQRLVVFHDSLLPRYRGFNPLVTALINGDTAIGVTACFATADYDRGDIVASSRQMICYPITISEAIDVLLPSYAELALKIGAALSQDRELEATPQTEADASYSLWRDDDDYFIDWRDRATTIRRFVDAVGYPYKGAASTLDGTVVRIVKVVPLGDVQIANRLPGKVIFILDSKPVVVCGEGLLRVDDMRDESNSQPYPLPRFRMRFKGPWSDAPGRR